MTSKPETNGRFSISSSFKVVSAAVANGGSHSEEISLLTPENCAATYETETTAVDVRQILGVRERYKEALKFLEATARSNANTRAPWCEARSV